MIDIEIGVSLTQQTKFRKCFLCG